MKLKLFLSTTFLAVLASLSLSAQAATEMDKTTAGASETKAATMNMSAEKGKPQKRHSHAEEKSGVPQSLPDANASAKPNPAKDPSRHLHPRDGK